MILEVLKQKIDPVISVFRRYKSDDKSAPRYLSCVTTLLNNKIYEPSHLDISEVKIKLCNILLCQLLYFYSIYFF